MVLKKNRKDTNVLFIDASNEFEKVTNNNQLKEHHIQKIVDKFINRENDDKYFSKLVKYTDIKDNNYNLSVSTYVEKEDTREVVDIKVLNEEIKRIVAREKELREAIDKIITEIEG